jgi:two-component system cell cycle response regulator
VSTRILVIEDNPANLELMTYLLEAFGYETVRATDGEAGLAQLEARSFDLVVCDIQLPKIDGYEVARRLRASAVAAPVLVAVTAFAMVGDRDRILAAGFHGYVAKPIVPETFVSEVEAFLPPPLRALAGARRWPSEPVPEPASSTRTGPGRGRVLVVDDVALNLDFKSSLLVPLGYEVAEARGVREAIERLGAGTFDLVISDVHLQDGTGYDLLRHVRAHAGLGGLPFLMVSSSARSPEDAERALALGARAFLSRPVEPEVLLPLLESCVAGRGER